MPGGIATAKAIRHKYQTGQPESEGRLMVRSFLRRSAGRERGAQIEREMEKARAY